MGPRIILLSDSQELYGEISHCLDGMPAEFFLIEPHTEPVHTFIAENWDMICLAIVDCPLENTEICEIQRFLQDSDSRIKWMGLVGDLSSEDILKLSRDGYTHLAKRNDFSEPGSASRLNLILTKFLNNQAQLDIAKEFEQILIVENEKNAAIIDSIETGILVTSSVSEEGDYQFQEYNQKFLQLCDIESIELENYSFISLQKSFTLEPWLQEALAPKSVNSSEIKSEIIESAQGVYLKRLTKPFMDGEGNPQGVVWCFQDISGEILLGYLDGLTGMYNRRYLEEQLRKEWERGARYGKGEECLSVIICDIDSFKNINDTYGHLEGDRILKELSLVIKESIRTVDIACRYGGEEFVIILPSTSLEDTIMVAERMRSETENHDFKLDRNVHISLGVAESTIPAFDETEYASRMEEGVVSLVARADAALYKAKNTGKNRVVVGECDVLAL